MSDYFDEKIQDADKRIDGNLDRLLGKGLNLPFVNTNSGPRKIMSGIVFSSEYYYYNGSRK